MKLVNLGKGAKVHRLGVNRNLIVVDDISKIDALINVEENGEIIHLDAEGNEVHTPESFAKKVTSQRNEIFFQLESEIQKLKNEVTQAKLLRELHDLKNYPKTMKGEWKFKQALIKFKDFAIDLGAKVVAEIVIKQSGL
ncbi:hypothetical protein C3415_07655 [Acinetobacter baumannii]|uniref:hypothetical protein n=1 Tax=Acinetobacter baumannii TaxID=470 RepID=UPI000CDE8115|nr:hypothetical protein [Acinetobacter baumannii]EKU0940060.1 hypothetical protein [Acinetobacter baumannii]EKV4083916.1 hypothetical protein [Acinetobacter baumannii]EKX7142160.1 hypothetical protein [Acinetobacter baumannii]MDA3480754.1 hypothetical protein [Acinetobacter baumannii]POZ09268.1 hypothetical protein C3415_07655 [Acinetobacter baumannii]